MWPSRALAALALGLLMSVPATAQTPSLAPSPASPTPARGAPAPGASPAALPIEVTGATFAEFDDATGITRMEGSPLVLTRGRTVIRAPRARYDRRTRVLTAEGGVDAAEPGITIHAEAAEYRLDDEGIRGTGDVRITDTRRDQSSGEEQQTTMRAPEVSGSLRTRRFVAAGGVTLMRGEWTLTGRRGEYDEPTRVAIITGDPQARFRDAVMTSDVVTLFLDREIIQGEGSVQLRRGDLTGRGRRVDVFMKERIAVLSGGAAVDRGADRLTAAEIETTLDGQRITARGTSRLVIVSPPTPTPTPTPR